MRFRTLQVLSHIHGSCTSRVSPRIMKLRALLIGRVIACLDIEPRPSRMLEAWTMDILALGLACKTTKTRHPWLKFSGSWRRAQKVNCATAVTDKTAIPPFNLAEFHSLVS